MSEINTIGELIKTYTPATTDQINAIYQGMGELSPTSFVWIDDDINAIKTANNLGMIVKNPKGQAVNLAILKPSKPYLLNHREKVGAGVFGDLGAECAYLVNDLFTALDLSFALKEMGERFCVLMAFGNIDKVAKTFCKTHRLILPIGKHKADELQDKIGNLPNVEIHACLDPVENTIERLKGNDTDTQIIKELDYPYLGGHFVIKDGKLFYSKLNSDTDHTTELFLSNALYIDGQTRDKTSGNWGKLLRFTDLDGTQKTWAMPNALLMGDGREYLKPLANMGLVIGTTAKAKALLTAYIQFHPCTNKLLCIDNVGWHGTAYALPHKIWGDGVVLQAEQMEHGYREKGTLSEWQKNISRPCINHNRLAFALCVSLTGAVLEPLGADSLGFHFVGASSMGKSLALNMGASVWGGREFVRTWKATGNGMESVASMHNDGFLALDELGECEPKQVGNVVYMLGNGTGKTRMNKDTTTRPSKKWRIAYLSTGETTLDGILKQAGQSIKAGQAVRLAHINAEAKYGMFDSLAGFKSGHELAEHLRDNAKRYHGTAGIAWLDYLTTHDYLAQLKAFIHDFTNLYDGLSSQAMRVCKHFATVAGVGELATVAGVTDWQAGQATQAVKACFDDWLATHGKHGDLELTALIECIVHTIERHQYSRMASLRHEAENLENNWTDGKPNFLGFIDEKNRLYLFTSAGFSEVSEPLPIRQAYQMLKAVNLTTANHRQQYQKKVNGKKRLFYAIKDEILTFLDNEP
ncbi:putative inner membrane protein [Moraxella catarrhalis]|uniref:DUF927 domain-containing protein n=1 Tax=Moraxella catarrhalis TaxID=480 RepID=UPI0007E79791|nr:DUF927 domain-containing protein [Moraxella catarrhalis]OAV34506.1 putative inner membrane protein [Moraxella catarrhalis]